MARFLVTAVLVFGLAGCAAEQVGEAAVDSGVLMSSGEHAAGLGRDDGKRIANETLVVANTPDTMDDYTIPARIYALPEDQGGKPLPFQDLTIFDVTAQLGIDPDLVGHALDVPDEAIEPAESLTATEIWPTPETPARAAVTGTSYLIQLGALPSRVSARREWSRIERRHPDLVQDQVLAIIPVELATQNGTVFRLRAGPITEITSARSLCRRFRNDGQDCFVVKSNNPS